MVTSDDPFQRDIRQIGAIREVPLILEVCRKATGMGFVAIARVTADRWVTCAARDDIGFGLAPGDELEVATTICRQVREAREVVAIEDVEASLAFRDHPTPRRYGFRSYVSVPILRTDGSVWGTLCAIDTASSRLGPETVAMFQLFAQLVAVQLDVQDELERGRSSLDSERAAARLREEFIAVVGHDLRNPLAAVSAGLRMLARERTSLPEGSRAALLIPEMQRSVLRMGQIIDNLLDFARGRLGAGIVLDAPAPVRLEPVLLDVAQEIERASGRDIRCALDLPEPIRCDPQRLGQLLSNLIGNAVLHGAADRPIRVEGAVRDGVLRLAVTNEGPAIPDEIRPSLFLPFSRGGQRASLQGLGLGLYIASEIAQAHGGRIEVDSTDAATTFALTMPAPQD